MAHRLRHLLARVRSIFQRQAVIEVALTLDDLPNSVRVLAPGERLRVVRSMLAALERHQAGKVIAFANGVESDEEGQQVLDAWVRAGHILGNHTFSHLHASQLTVAEFMADVDRNEKSIRRHWPEQLAGEKWFRFPFLDQGKLDDRSLIRDQLERRRYRIAPGTLSTLDWAWDKIYDQGQAERTSAVRRAFVAGAVKMMLAESARARAMFGHSIPLLLVMHFRQIEGDALDELLAQLRAHGARFVSLEGAMRDPAYVCYQDSAWSKCQLLTGDALEKIEQMKRAEGVPPT